MVKDAGIIYMSFGSTSQAAAQASLASIRKLGIDLPAISVGTMAIPGTTFLKWRGDEPWGEHAWKGKRFRAGRVKPFLIYYSPFEFNLYLDADTLALEDFQAGFDYLQAADVCIADDDRRPLEDLYRFTKTGPEWDSARAERDQTSQILGNPPHKMINSGVIFFRKNDRSQRFFQAWYREWLRWGGWDEQMAFLRAEHACDGVTIRRLPNYWNEHNESRRRIIWHRWGSARDLSEIPVRKSE